MAKCQKKLFLPMTIQLYHKKIPLDWKRNFLVCLYSIDTLLDRCARYPVSVRGTKGEIGRSKASEKHCRKAVRPNERTCLVYDGWSTSSSRLYVRDIEEHRKKTFVIPECAHVEMSQLAMVVR